MRRRLVAAAPPLVPSFGSLLPAAPQTRRGIPLYHHKSEAEYREDIYERYDELVTRQTALHLADELHGSYPFQPSLNYIERFLPPAEELCALDLGCSVGRLIASLANRHPSWDCYGVDYSYQMLRQAREYWLEGRELRPNLLRLGFGSPVLRRGAAFDNALKNLRFALAKAEVLPFPDASLDLLVNTFLIDRLSDAMAAYREWYRVLKPGGRVITVSPLNFLSVKEWRDFHPPIKIIDFLTRNGWTLEDWTDPLLLREPMDARGNAINWRCIAFVLEKL